MVEPRKIVIIGAGGRDFHNFNVVYRDNPNYRVVAFLATQIPGITGKRYPASLAGKLYPNGIPIMSLDLLEDVITRYGVEEAVLSFSDLTYDDVGHILSRVLAAGASFKILGPVETMIESSKPVIAVVAVRTGAGKSSVSREVVRYLISKNYRVGIVRHPMAYGDLEKMAIQKFTSYEDLDKYQATIEEREEYEHYIKMGLTVYAGVDYGKLLEIVEKENDIILWDGGNNDWPFYKPDYMITVADAMRPGHEVGSFPGEVNTRLADAVIINKVDQARKEDIDKIIANIKKVNPRAKISLAESVVEVDAPEVIEGKKVVVIEDSPTVTHGGLPYAAGYVAAKKYGAAEIIDPRPYAVGIIKELYEKYPHMGPVLPSTGYSPEQLRDLEETLKKIPADAIVLGTPSDITRLITVEKPVTRVSFRVKIVEGPTIEELVEEFLEKGRRKLESSE
ncbi:GTPase [Desulfurococcaceae archaeon MEX13E-LK6-19]|nr:GTPase [Desulfurococcaceae archaeon MEX13E-LK6-19]